MGTQKKINTTFGEEMSADEKFHFYREVINALYEAEEFVLVSRKEGESPEIRGVSMDGVEILDGVKVAYQALLTEMKRSNDGRSVQSIVDLITRN